MVRSWRSKSTPNLSFLSLIFKGLLKKCLFFMSFKAKEHKRSNANDATREEQITAMTSFNVWRNSEEKSKTNSV